MSKPTCTRVGFEIETVMLSSTRITRMKRGSIAGSSLCDGCDGGLAQIRAAGGKGPSTIRRACLHYWRGQFEKPYILEQQIHGFSLDGGSAMHVGLLIQHAKQMLIASSATAFATVCRVTYPEDSDSSLAVLA